MLKYTLSLKKDNISFTIVKYPLAKFNRRYYIVNYGDMRVQFDFYNSKSIATKVYYKDSIFRCSPLSINNWSVSFLNENKTIVKRNEKILIPGSNNKNEKELVYLNANLTFQDNDRKIRIREIDTYLKMKYSNLYDKINDKETLCNNIYDVLSCDDSIEYNSTEFLFKFDVNNCYKIKKFLINYILSEKDLKDLHNIINIDMILESNKLEQYSTEEIKKAYRELKDEYFDELSIIDIDYNRNDIINDFIEELNNKILYYRKIEYLDSLPGKIEKELIKRKFTDEYISVFVNEIISDFSKLDDLNDILLIKYINEYEDLYKGFINDYKKIMDYYHSDKVEVVLNDEAINQYKDNISNLDVDSFKKFELVIKPVYNEYRLYCCKKNSMILKPTLSNTDTFVAYVRGIYNILIDNYYLIENDTNFKINKEVDYDKIKWLIKNLKL